MDKFETDWTENGQEMRRQENLPSGLNFANLPGNACRIPATHKTLPKSFEERL